MPGEARARLRKPLERSLALGHPWIYRDALDELDARPGEVVTVLGKRGGFVARGFADAGPIGVRVLTVADEPLGPALFERRVRAAAELRDRVVPPDTDAYRLVHGEGDRLPGLVCDVYGQHAVMQLDGEGVIAWRDQLLEALTPALDARAVTTVLVRTGRRGSKRLELARGAMPDAPVIVREHAMKLEVDLVQGQKTGLFLDHRESRARARALGRGRRVLNLYGYTGGFSVAAGLGGASRVTTVDVAEGAVRAAERNWGHNALDPARHLGETSDVGDWLTSHARGHERFDFVIADPPSFAPNEAALEAALASYVELHQRALALVAPGGLYLAASCSSHVDRAAFEQTLRVGAERSRRVLQVLDRWGAPPDHPTLVAFPEGDYLKCTLLRALD